MAESYRRMAVVLLTALLLAPMLLVALARPTPLDPVIDPGSGTVVVPGSLTPSGIPVTGRTRPAQTGGGVQGRKSLKTSSGAGSSFKYKAGNVNAYGYASGDAMHVFGVISGGNGTPSWNYSTNAIDWDSFFGVPGSVTMSLDPLFLYIPLSGGGSGSGSPPPVAPPRPPPPPPPPISPSIVVYVQLEGAPSWLARDLADGRAYWVVRTPRGEHSLSGGQLPYSGYVNGVRLLATRGSYLRVEVESLYIVDGGRVLGYNVSSWRLLYGGPDPYNLVNPRLVYRADGPRVSRTLTRPGGYKLVAVLAAAQPARLVNYKTASWLPDGLNATEARAAGTWVYALPGDPVALYGCQPPPWMNDTSSLARAGGHYHSLLERLGPPAGAAAPLHETPGNTTIHCPGAALTVVYAPVHLAIEWRWDGDTLQANATAAWPDGTPVYGHLLSWTAPWGLQVNIQRTPTTLIQAQPPPSPGNYTLQPAAYPGLNALLPATAVVCYVL